MKTLKEYQQIVYDTAKSCGLSDNQAKIIVAQAMHESAKFTSNVFRTDNNAFGLKMPTKRDRRYIERPSTIVMQSEGSTPYAHYSSLQNCIKDLILSWHTYNKTDWNKIQTPEQYAAYLKSKGYYGDSQTNYTNAISNFIKSLGGLKQSAPIIGFVIAGIALFLYLKKQ